MKQESPNHKQGTGQKTILIYSLLLRKYNMLRAMKVLISFKRNGDALNIFMIRNKGKGPPGA